MLCGGMVEADGVFDIFTLLLGKGMESNGQG